MGKQGRLRLFLAIWAVCFLFAAAGGAACAAPAADGGITVSIASPGEIAAVPQGAAQDAQAIYPGQAFLARVQGPGLTAATFEWRGQSRRIAARQEADGTGVAEMLLPLPYEEKTGTTAILCIKGTVDGKTVALERKLPIRAKKYPEQALSVDSRFVQLSQKDLERSKRERQETKPVLEAFTPGSTLRVPFARPVPGNLTSGVSSRYGLKRVFNGEPRGHHRGLDLRGAEGTPIRACADGTVALAANHFFSGNVVYLDHGEGVVTMYAHMSRIAVKPGEKVKAGDVIGYVGSTGRVTGPHLHLGLVVQGVSVDALPFLEKDAPGTGEAASAKKGALKGAAQKKTHPAKGKK